MPITPEALQDPAQAAYSPVVTSGQTFSGAALADQVGLDSGFGQYIDDLTAQARQTYAPPKTIGQFQSSMPTVDGLKQQLVGFQTQVSTDLSQADSSEVQHRSLAPLLSTFLTGDDLGSIVPTDGQLTLVAQTADREKGSGIGKRGQEPIS